MKWDKENKDRLLLILRRKAEEIRLGAKQGGVRGYCDRLRSDTRAFLSSFGLRMIVKDRDEWREVSYVLGGPEPPVKRKNGIIIRYPFYDDADCLKYGWGLQVPKDVAEKFLILGAP